MKYCKECGAKNKNRAEECVSCGADTFEFHCEKCGTVFDGSMERCPNCRLKAGLRKKTCPECGREYFGEECPECGYTPETKSKGKKSSGPWVYIIIGIAVLLVLGLLALIVFKPGRTNGFRISRIGKKAEVSTYVAGEAEHKNLTGNEDAFKETGQEARKLYEDLYAFSEEYLSFIKKYTTGDNYKTMGDQFEEIEKRRTEIMDNEYRYNLDERSNISTVDRDYCVKLAEKAYVKIYEAFSLTSDLNARISQ